jgi:hypothetical protein
LGVDVIEPIAVSYRIVEESVSNRACPNTQTEVTGEQLLEETNLEEVRAYFKDPFRPNVLDVIWSFIICVCTTTKNSSVRY